MSRSTVLWTLCLIVAGALVLAAATILGVIRFVRAGWMPAAVIFAAIMVALLAVLAYVTVVSVRDLLE